MRHRAPQHHRDHCEAGYNLAALMVMIMIMNIMLAVAVPTWTVFVQRDKEAEAIFRGLQYAEAIRVFQQRHGRVPTTLEELIKVEPRSIRQLYENPLNESGKWGLLIQSHSPPGAPPPPGSGQNAGEEPVVRGARGRANQQGKEAGGVGAGGNNNRGGVIAVPPIVDDDKFGSSSKNSLRGPAGRAAGPLVGVYLAAEGEALRSFNGSRNYNEWRFLVEMIPAPAVVGGDAPAPRVTSEWIGKPFRSDLTVTSPARGKGPTGGQELGGGVGPRVPAKDFRPGRQNAGPKTRPN